MFSVFGCSHDEKEESVVPTASSLPLKPESPPPPALPVSQEPLPPPAVESSESSSTEESSSSSSDTVTETETAARHISEGELMFSHSQRAAVRGTLNHKSSVTNPSKPCLIV